MIFRVYHGVVLLLTLVLGSTTVDAQVSTPIGLRSATKRGRAPSQSLFTIATSNPYGVARNTDSTTVADKSAPKGLIGAAVGATVGAGAGYLFGVAVCDTPSCDARTPTITGAVVGGLIGFGLELLFRLPH